MRQWYECAECSSLQNVQGRLYQQPCFEVKSHKCPVKSVGYHDFFLMQLSTFVRVVKGNREGTKILQMKASKRTRFSPLLDSFSHWEGGGG